MKNERKVSARVKLPMGRIKTARIKHEAYTMRLSRKR
jgi:hypothetical protein